MFRALFFTALCFVRVCKIFHTFHSKSTQKKAGRETCFLLSEQSTFFLKSAPDHA